MNILLTAIGSASALSVLNSLSKHGNIVYGTDIYDTKWIYGSEKFKKTFRVPTCDKENYVSDMLNIVIENKIDILIPLTDLECDTLSRYKELFLQHNAIIACLDEKLNALCRDKFTLQKILSDIVDTIETYNINDDYNLPFPLIAKPIHGRSSQGLYIIKDKNELDIIKSNYTGYIVQKLINGSIFTVDCVQDSFGNCVCLARKELLRTSNGLGITVEFFDHTTVEEKAKKIMQNLKIIGCVNMEFIYDGKYNFLELNPRFSGGVGFSIMQGYDFANAHILAHTKQRIPSYINYKSAILRQGYEKQ